MQKKIPITILCTVAVAIIALFTATQLMAQAPPEECTTDLKGNEQIWRPLPNANGEWPYVVIYDPEAKISCPEGVRECLAWPYVCEGKSCGQISIAYVSLHRCGDNPIVPLSDKNGPIQDTQIFYCDETGPNQNQWPDSCNSFTARITADSFAGGKRGFWFTTQLTVDLDWMDIYARAGNSESHCADGIAGPGCGEELFGAYQAFSSTNEITVALIKKRYSRKHDGCVYKVEFWNDPANCEGGEGCPIGQTAGWVDAIEFTDPPEIWTETLVGAGSTKGDSDICGDFRFTLAGSPGWDCDYIRAQDRICCSCIGYYYAPYDWCCDPSGCKPRP